MCVLCRERDEMVYKCMPTAGKPSVKKTGFVYADAQTVHLAMLTCYTLSPSIVKRLNTHEK